MSYLAIPGGSPDSLRAYAVGRATAFLGLSNPVIWDEPFLARPGVANSFFSTASGTASDVTSLNGGWKRIACAAGAGSAAYIVNAQFGAIVANVGTQKFYCLWQFRIPQAIDAASVHQIGFIDTGFSADQPCFGVQGSASTTKFRFFDGATGVTSSVNIDQGVHIGEMGGNGAGTIFGSIDGEAIKSYVTAKTAAMTPFVQNANGATGGVQATDLGQVIIVTDQS